MPGAAAPDTIWERNCAITDSRKFAGGTILAIRFTSMLVRALS
ncbi:Uncharacterised protein [Bordetella pertussis]|nr:hypothetical protein [Bordetella pertussis]CFO12293.1 Uncharacterised protein [Bordetella pertussis]CFO81782.1 Uncharacterised protein [Bordetella pertussis]CFU85629.1 Uncharacterised protein [Bordetella pertussis]CPI79214.1 Uncharacterised protein [Bordetella pertussis]CPL28743.1 Uncharacterised protein [Bordetella pertussis]